MPKEKRKRTSLRVKAASLGSENNRTFASNSTPKHVTIGSNVTDDANTILKSFQISQITPHPSKKEKRHAKRNTFLSKLDAMNNSKSNESRRKKENLKNLSVDLNQLKSSLPSVLPLPEEQNHKLHSSSKFITPQNIKIGASSKSATSIKDRKKIMSAELTRFNAVLTHPAFQKNPLEAIRQHSQNTLVKRENPPSLPLNVNAMHLE